MPTATKKKKEAKAVEFISRDQNLRLVREPKRNQMNPQTGEISVTPGVSYEFEPNGVLVVDPSDSEALDFLRSHSLCGSMFVEKGNEPDRPPDASEILNEIVDAAVAKDADKLVEIYLAERSSNSRPEVLGAAARAIEKLDGDVPAAPPTPAHQLERFRDPSVETAPEAPEATVEADYPDGAEKAE